MTHHPHDHDHGDDHDHDDPHAPRKDHDAGTMSPYELLEEAVRTLLVEKGVFSNEEIAAQVNLTDSRTPATGSAVIAKAWTDVAFKKKLLAHTRAALVDVGIDIGANADYRTVENTAKVHNVIVCTLCSCYPKPLLGIPPAWYKSMADRSRVVREPRAVLDEFGVEMKPGVEVRVHDSTAELRYLVLPMRPKGTEGWSEKELAKLVTRDAMIGTAVPTAPKKSKAASI